MRNQLSFFRADIDTNYTTDERHLITRVGRSIGRCLSVVLAAYEAANRYQQLAKVSRAELERRGIARGDLIRDVFRILMERN